MVAGYNYVGSATDDHLVTQFLEYLLVNIDHLEGLSSLFVERIFDGTSGALAATAVPGKKRYAFTTDPPLTGTDIRML